MKQRKKTAVEELCAEIRPEDGIPPHLLKRQSAKEKQQQHQNRRRIDRHTLQYCKAAWRSLEGALPAVIAGFGPATEWSVATVEPVTGSGGSVLLVVVSAAGAGMDDLLSMENHLQQASGPLRAAIAGDTRRKRVPHLRFRAVAAAEQNRC